MALRVLGQVDHQSDDCGWQLFSADASRIREDGWIQRPNHLFGLVQRFVYFDRATSIVRALDPSREGLPPIVRA